MIEIFSYWIFIWFLCFYFGFTNFNPLFILIAGYILTFFEFLYLIYKKTLKYNLIKFAIINVIIKIIPILLIIKFPIIFNIQDIILSLYLFAFYILIMSILNKNPYIYYIKMINTYIYNTNEYKSYVSQFYDLIYNILYK